MTISESERIAMCPPSWSHESPRATPPPECDGNRQSNQEQEDGEDDVRKGHAVDVARHVPPGVRYFLDIAQVGVVDVVEHEHHEHRQAATNVDRDYPLAWFWRSSRLNC